MSYNAVASVAAARNKHQMRQLLAAGGVPTINVATTGTKTVNVWMREDGVKVDRVFLTTESTRMPTLGNAWHIATSIEGGVGWRPASTIRRSQTTGLS